MRGAERGGGQAAGATPWLVRVPRKHDSTLGKVAFPATTDPVIGLVSGLARERLYTWALDTRPLRRPLLLQSVGTAAPRQGLQLLDTTAWALGGHELPMQTDAGRPGRAQESACQGVPLPPTQGTRSIPKSGHRTRTEATRESLGAELPSSLPLVGCHATELAGSDCVPGPTCKRPRLGGSHGQAGRTALDRPSPHGNQRGRRPLSCPLYLPPEVTAPSSSRALG